MRLELCRTFRGTKGYRRRLSCWLCLGVRAPTAGRQAVIDPMHRRWVPSCQSNSTKETRARPENEFFAIIVRIFRHSRKNSSVLVPNGSLGGFPGAGEVLRARGQLRSGAVYRIATASLRVSATFGDYGIKSGLDTSLGLVSDG